MNVHESKKDMQLGIVSTVSEGYPTVECTQLQLFILVLYTTLSFQFIFAFHFRALHFYCV